MTTMYKNLVIVFLLSGVVLAESDLNDPTNWDALKDKSLEHGCPVDRVEQTLRACRKQGLSVQDADKLLNRVYAAQLEGLPADCIYDRIEEGLAKQVEMSRIATAVQSRLDNLRKARELVSPILNGMTGSRHGPPHLIANIGMALESGLPVDVLEAVIDRNGHRRLGRLAHTVEMGETLQLSGFQPQQIQRVLIDMLDRNLNRHEMLMAVEVLKEGRASGKDFESVYSTLWVSSN